MKSPRKRRRERRLPRQFTVLPIVVPIEDIVRELESHP